LREKRVAVNENELRPYLGQLVVANKVNGEVLRGKFQRTHPSVLELKRQEGRGYDYEVLGEERVDDPYAAHQLVRADEIESIDFAWMTVQEATAEMGRLIESHELRPYKCAKQMPSGHWVDVLPYGSIGILPNPNLADQPVPPDVELRVVYQDHDGGRTVDVTGWSGADVLDLIKKRAAEDGLPWPEPKH
jgi:hypothetical protein